MLPAVAAGQTPGVDVADLGGLETRSAALILSGQEAGDLETSVLAIPMPGSAGAGGATRVVLVVDIDGESLLVGAGEDSLVTEVYAYAVDGRGRLGGVLTQAFRIDLASHRAALAASGVKFLGHLDLPPGDYSLRILVLHRHADRLRLNVESLTVPPPRERFLLPPLFPEPVERWIVVRETSSAETSSAETVAAELAFPRVTDGRAWVPATRPSTADRASFYLAGRGLTGGLRAHIVDGDRGEVLSELGLGDLRLVDDPPFGLEMVAAEIRTAGLAGGRYRLRISSADGVAETSIVLRIPVPESERAVRDELDEPPVESVGSGKRVAVPRGRALVRLLEQAQAAYLVALGHLSAGDPSRALTAIIELERAGIGERLTDDTPKVQEQLKGAQVTVAARLVGRQVEGLVALISLHERLYRRYYEHHHYFLADHTRQVLTALADLYLLRSRSPEAARLVASAVASLGGYLHQLGARPAALEIYQQALEYDPRHPASLLASAMLHEAGSDYETAEGLLRKLVAEDSEDRRAKLHLAVNSRRLGAARRAVKLLEECIDDDPPNWITVLAYQELASIHAADKRPQEAIAVLEKALERISDEQALYLQLAALFDRTGRPARATAVLRRFDSRVARATASPRLLYGQPPISHIVRNRRVLAGGVDSRLPALAETVSHFAAADDPGDAAPGPGRR
ncbi:MAG: tetratricopeptide repeat protein [Thermoanaerobaculia bacterium]